MKKTADTVLRPVRPIIQPDSARRVELRHDPKLADSIDEDIFITRSRISSLNSIINGLLSNISDVRFVKPINWGLFSLAVTKDNRNDVPITHANIGRTDHLNSIINIKIPELDWVQEFLNEDDGVYGVTASRNNKIVGGLLREMRAEAWLSALCALGIQALNDKIAIQYQLLNQQEIASPVPKESKRTGFDLLKGPEVIPAFDDLDPSF